MSRLDEVRAVLEQALDLLDQLTEINEVPDAGPNPFMQYADAWALSAVKFQEAEAQYARDALWRWFDQTDWPAFMDSLSADALFNVRFHGANFLPLGREGQRTGLRQMLRAEAGRAFQRRLDAAPVNDEGLTAGG